jgi:hypothetical protein
MFARKIQVEILGPEAQPRLCPLEWLDNFCMRSFTGRSAFDDTLPVADGMVEVGSRVDLRALKTDLEDWLRRKFFAGTPAELRFTEIRRE